MPAARAIGISCRVTLVIFCRAAVLKTFEKHSLWKKII
jgi:hypothetical protein